jgi:hypothetical protein
VTDERCPRLGGLALLDIDVFLEVGEEMMLFGSTANQVVRRASCPVLTLRR